MHAEASFSNPILPGDRPDPSVLKVGDEYWMTYSSFEAAPGLLLYRSADLVHWEFECAALPEPIGSTFAVDIAEHNGHFYIYIPFIPTPWSSLTDASIFVIHAPSMSGPWSAPIDLGIRGAIDPGHVVGEDGTRYLFVSGIRRIALAGDGLSTVGELEQVYDGWQYPDEWITEAYSLEGPKLLRKDDWFYLVSAVGGTAGPPTGHMVIVARSRSVHGPWENHPRNPIARTQDASERWWSRGHATLVHGSSDEWWMVSHGYENGYRTLGRQILLEPIRWTDDGWPEATVADPAGELRAPTGASAQDAAPDFHDDFSTLRLGDRWSFHAPSPGEIRRLTLGDGLRLRGKGTSPTDTSPLAMLTGDHSYEVEVDITLESAQVQAGLLLFFNNRLFCGMGIDTARLATYAGGVRSHWQEPAPATDRITLRLRNEEHTVTGWYRIPGGEWVRHGIRYETSGYHANTIGDLLSLRPALFATGDGTARFSDFHYRAIGRAGGSVSSRETGLI